MAMKRDVDEVIDEAETATFSGWDFSWLAGRAQETQPPWNYKEEAAAAFRVTLDVDTGGDEVLAQLAPFRGRVVATEGYLPTIAIAAARLILLERQSWARDRPPTMCCSTRLRPPRRLQPRVFFPFATEASIWYWIATRHFGRLRFTVFWLLEECFLRNSGVWMQQACSPRILPDLLH
jgi:hypothetical protein